MFFQILISVLPLIIPYTILGENFAAIILSFFAVIYLLQNKESCNLNKKYFISLLALSSVAVISQLILSRSIQSFAGVFCYINMILYYLIFSIVLKGEEQRFKVIDYAIYLTLVSLIFFIFVQGLYYKVRIYGNIGYANTYALLLLIMICLNRYRFKDKYGDIFESIFIVGILFTGSRTTLILLALYFVMMVIEKIKLNKCFKIGYFENLIWAVIQYWLYESIGVAAIFIMPIVICSFFVIKKLKYKEYFYLIFLGCAVALVAFNNSNTFARIRNISLKSGSLQERIIIFKHSIGEIIQQPFGNGINMFRARVDIKELSYSVKYIHNSLLQISYDIGIIGGIIFILILIIGISGIIKSKEKQKKLLAYMYISIFIHSLLDFDFSYSTVSILWAMIYALSLNVNTTLKINLMSKCRK